MEARKEVHAYDEYLNCPGNGQLTSISASHIRLCAYYISGSVLGSSCIHDSMLDWKGQGCEASLPFGILNSGKSKYGSKVSRRRSWRDTLLPFGALAGRAPLGDGQGARQSRRGGNGTKI